jgi:hypothetical protein
MRLLMSRQVRMHLMRRSLVLQHLRLVLMVAIIVR